MALKDKDSAITWDEVARQLDVNLNGNAIRKRVDRYKATLLNGNAHISIDGFDVDGVLPEDHLPDEDDIDELLENLFKAQDKRFNLAYRMKEVQTITIPKLPCAIALFSDLHIGDEYADYKAIIRDAEIVSNTEGLYAGFAGDGINNWIIGRLTAKQRDEVMSYKYEWAVFFRWLDLLKEKLLFCVTGNHDNWTYKLAGFDRIAEHLDGVKTLYDRDQIVFNLKTGPYDNLVGVRHKWKGHSQWNATHGIEKGMRGFMGHTVDIGIGGHTHAGTIFRDFIWNGKKQFACLLGVYKVHDDYAREIGFPDSYSTGCGALVFDVDGSITKMDNLEQAAKYLKFLREEANAG